MGNQSGDVIGIKVDNPMILLDRAYYQAPIRDSLGTTENEILGELTRNHGHALEGTQRAAWLEQCRHLQGILKSSDDGHIFFEFSIPRMGRRVDVVLLLGGVVIVIEYKVGATTYYSEDINQAIDYALDLKNFHSGCHDLPIVPILVATEAPDRLLKLIWNKGDAVADIVLANRSTLQDILKRVTEKPRKGIRASSWLAKSYKPTPTIVEAATALYQGHNVQEISRSDGGAINLSKTAKAISIAIDTAKAQDKKVICFVTGVPGSGKTLAGLNLATERMKVDESEHAVFLSGNGPLVKVLREALARDQYDNAKLEGKTLLKTAASRKVEAFIQNIHHFRDENLRSDEPPIERVAVFDEAQRAWTQAKLASFMKEKRQIQSFGMTEPEFLLSVMDRHHGWSAIVCLIGNGQEINTGEAGLAEWFRALSGPYQHWNVECSDQLGLMDSTLDADLGGLIETVPHKISHDLHLSVSVRSFRSESVAAFVKAIIDGHADLAKQHHQSLKNYPIVLTRELNIARKWLRNRARGTERYGLVASSNSLRLRPFGIHMKSKINETAWFLNTKEDVRSSYALEEAGSEFEIQGLELDWVGVCWDANFRYSGDGWNLHNFRGTNWVNIKDAHSRSYLANAYRVLLTRARQGMVVFIPRGSEIDATCDPDFYDGTFDFLKKCGIPELE